MNTETEASAENPTGAKDRVVKSGMIKVRNHTTQPVNLNGVIIEPAVRDKAGKLVKEAPVTEIEAKELPRVAGFVTKVGCLIAVLLALGGTPAKAQQFLSTSLPNTNGLSSINGGTNNVAATATNSYYAPIGLTRFSDAIIEVSGKPVSSSTGNLIWRFSDSPDGTNWSQRAMMLTTSTSTVKVFNSTNPVVNSVGYWRIDTLSNTNAEAWTNITIQVVTKPRRNG